MYYTYVLKSTKNGTFYIGYTKNLEKRIAFHNAGRQRYTKNFIPYTLVYYKTFETKRQAIQYENYLKSLKGGNEFYQIINSW